MGLCRQWWLYGAAFPPIDHGDVAAAAAAAAATAAAADDDDAAAAAAADDDDDRGAWVLGAGERLRRCLHR